MIDYDEAKKIIEFMKSQGYQPAETWSLITRNTFRTDDHFFYVTPERTIGQHTNTARGFVCSRIPSNILKFFDLLGYDIIPYHAEMTGQDISDWWE